MVVVYRYWSQVVWRSTLGCEDCTPIFYLMLVAGTTFYRKSTAYKLAEQVARDAIPHMLMPTPGSPERFQEALAGRMPSNFDKLTKQQARSDSPKAQPIRSTTRFAEG